MGCNVSAYCLNNPVNFVDSNGYDAIWIQESESAAGFGHSGLMVQDGDGNWFYFYWGPADETPRFELITGVPNGSYVESITTNGADLHDIEVLRAILAASGGKAAERASEITDIYYFEGDYTATLAEANRMAALEELYYLLTNNCVQKTITAFFASDIRFGLVAYGTADYLIPNSAVEKVAMLPSNKEDYPSELISYYICVG